MGNLAGHLLESCERRVHMHIMQTRQNCRTIEINHTGVVIDMRFDGISSNAICLFLGMQLLKP